MMQYTTNEDTSYLDALANNVTKYGSTDTPLRAGNRVTDYCPLTRISSNLTESERVTLSNTSPQMTFYNDGYSEILVNPDLLRLRFIGNMPELDTNETRDLTNGYTISRVGQSKLFRHICILSHEGTILGELCYGAPFGKNENYVYFKYHNELLYISDAWMYLESIPERLTKQFNLEFDRISNFDIALDGANFSNFFKNIVQYKQLKQSNVRDEYINGVYRGTFVGSRKSTNYIRYYHKSKELEKGHKPYIKDIHDKLGYSDDVMRFELCFTSKYFHTRTVDFYSLFKNGQWNLDYLVQLFKDGISYTFDFVRSDEFSKIKTPSKRKRIKFFDFSMFSNISIPRSKKVVQKSIQRAKTYISQSIKEASRHTDEVAYFLLKSASIVMRNHNLDKWLIKSSPYLYAACQDYHSHHFSEGVFRYQDNNFHDLLTAVNSSEI